jgi:hypothetical protein
MKSWTGWETVKHHVSICGQVLDTNGRPVPGVHLDIVPHTGQSESQPEKSLAGRSSRRKGATTHEELEGSGMRARKETTSRSDGTFFFLDCPDGEYTLKALDTQSGLQIQQVVHSNQDAIKKPMKDRRPNEGYQIELVLK